MDFNLNIVSLNNQTVTIDQEILYDIIILGGGPAAMTAAVYCMRKGVKCALITKNFGGQMAETSAIENYMGYKFIDGSELRQKFKEQIQQFELAILEGVTVISIENGPHKKIMTDNGFTYKSKTVIVTTGKNWRKLNVPGEKELTGKGVAYCSICDAPLFSGKKTAVIGGGNSGIESAIDLAKVAEKVTIIQNLNYLTADKMLLQKLEAFKNITIIYNSEVVEIKGKDFVNSIIIKDTKTTELKELFLDGIFIEIGLIPNSELLKNIVLFNEYNEIVVDCLCRTSVEGIYAAGDVSSVRHKQIIIAAGEGAKAALTACDYILHDKV